MEPIRSSSGSYYSTDEDQEPPPLTFLQKLLSTCSLELVHKPHYLQRLVRLVPKEEAPEYAEKLVTYLKHIDSLRNPLHIPPIEKAFIAMNDNIPLFDALSRNLNQVIPVPRSTCLISILQDAIKKDLKDIIQYVLDDPDLSYDQELFAFVCHELSENQVEKILLRFLTKTSHDKIMQFFANSLSLATRTRMLWILDFLEKNGFNFTAQLHEFSQPEMLAAVHDLKTLDYFVGRLELEKRSEVLQKVAPAYLIKTVEMSDALRHLDEAIDYFQSQGISLQNAFLERNTQGRRLLDQACWLHLQGVPEWIVQYMEPETLREVLGPQDPPFLTTYEHCLANTSENEFELALSQAQFIQCLQISLEG